MKSFRITDLLVQALLILSGIAFGVKSLLGSSEAFICFYFIVGGWQITSMLIHYFSGTHTVFYHQRLFYARLCLIVFCIGTALGSLSLIFPDFISLLLLYGFALLWLSPVLAFYYLNICCKEYRLISKRELIHLK